MRIKTKGYLFILAPLLGGALMPIVLATVKSASLIEFFMLSYLLGIFVALGLLLYTKKQATLTSYLKEPKKLGLMVVMGILIYVPFEVIILYAEHYVTASLTSVVFRTSPLLMLVFLPTVLREKLSWSQVTALMLGFAGVFIAFTDGLNTSVLGNPNLPIVALLALGALGYALTTVLMKRYAFDMSSNLLVFQASLFVIFALLFFATGMQASQLTLPMLGAMLYVAVDNVIPYYMYFNAFRILKTTFVSNVFFLSPFITLVCANLLLGEPIQPYYVMIALLVTAGLVIQRYDKIGGTYASKKDSAAHRFTIFDVTGAFANSGEFAIGDVIRNGGRVLALRLGDDHKSTVDELVSEGYHTNVFTDEHLSVANEADFVREVVGVREHDIVVMKAGDPDECERFFDELSERLEVGEEEGGARFA